MMRQQAHTMSTVAARPLFRASIARSSQIRPVHAQSFMPKSTLTEIGIGELARTPHSGYHYDGTPRRFFEGWYFKVRGRITIPEADNASFAFIYSIEDPSGASPTSGVGVQVMGPDDGYLLHHSGNVKDFWGNKSELQLGHSFTLADSYRGPTPQALTPRELFFDSILHGFQASSTLNQGSIIDQPGFAAGQNELKSTVSSCKWEYSTRPVFGWGNRSGRQQATAGWLASLPVFEPHWQVLMSHGLSSGWVEWNGRRIEFRDAPSYVEKNWGGGFPSKWFWVQCNTFDDYPSLALTTGGGRRSLPLSPPGMGEEDVAMIGVHFRGQFIEIAPWNGVVEWDVSPWGKWSVTGRSGRYIIQVEAETRARGTPLRAPTQFDGLAPFCRDTFDGEVKLTIFDVQRSSVRPWLVATSKSGALEVGGGPWWSEWRARAEMKEPWRSLVQLPIEPQVVAEWLPRDLRPPGL